MGFLYTNHWMKHWNAVPNCIDCRGSKAMLGLVYSRKGVVHDGTWLPFPLGNVSGGGKLEVGKTLNHRKGQHCPISHLNVVIHASK